MLEQFEQKIGTTEPGLGHLGRSKSYMKYYSLKIYIYIGLKTVIKTSLILLSL